MVKGLLGTTDSANLTCARSSPVFLMSLSLTSYVPSFLLTICGTTLTPLSLEKSTARGPMRYVVKLEKSVLKHDKGEND